MGKKFYAVKFKDGSNGLYNSCEKYQTAIRGSAGFISNRFSKQKNAKQWLKSENLQTWKKAGPENKTETVFHAIANGRFVGVTENESTLLKSVQNYHGSCFKMDFKTKREAFQWLKSYSITQENSKGIFAVARGWHTGVFRYRNTFFKNMMCFPCAVGRGGFQSLEEAKKWLEQKRRSLEKEYFAVAVGNRRGVFSKFETYQKNIRNVAYPWSKRGFKTKNDARNWLKERLYYVSDFKKDSSLIDCINSKCSQLPVMYTDGSFYSSQKKYSSSIVLCDTDGSVSTFTKAVKMEKVSSLGNMIAEIQAVDLCLKLAHSVFGFKEFILVYDLDIIKEIILKGPKFQGRAEELQEQMRSFIMRNGMTIHYVSVKSHNGVLGNDLADRLAKQACKALDQTTALRDIRKIIS